MSFLLDYLELHKDDSISDFAFNKIDALLFGELQLLDFTNEFKDRDSLTVNELFLEYIKTNDINTRVAAIVGVEPKTTLKQMAMSKRFKDMIIEDYVNKSDTEKVMHFGVFTVLLDEKHKLIVFAPTNDTLNSWLEDINISVMTIPSNYEGVKYSLKALEKDDKDIYLVGHSKGAHIAMYVCLNVDSDRIKECYAFDGPGFKDNEFNDVKYDNDWKKITCYTPVQSSIGRIFQAKAKTYIMSSDAEMLEQHGAYVWKIENDDFVYEDKYYAASNYMKIKINKLIAYVGSDIYKLIDASQKLLKGSSCKTMTDLYEPGVFKKNYNDLDSESKRLIKKYFVRYFMNDFRFLQIVIGLYTKNSNPKVFGIK